MSDSVMPPTPVEVPADSNGAMVGGDDIKAQTRQVFENIKAVLAAGGATMDDVVELVSYHTNMADLGAVAEVKAEYIARDFPAWTALGVS